MILHLFGHEAGYIHELKLLRRSGISEILQENMCIGGKKYYIYGDAAYLIRAWMQVDLPRVTATAGEQAFNAR